MNESFLFYRVFSEALKDLPAEEFKNCVIAICDYALDGKSQMADLPKDSWSS